MSAVASPLQLQLIFRIKFPLYEGLPRLPKAVDLAVRHNLHVGAASENHSSLQVSDWENISRYLIGVLMVLKLYQNRHPCQSMGY